MRLIKLGLVGQKGLFDITLEREEISNVSAHVENGQAGVSSSDSIIFEDAVAFPGLINSHEHLDFNCFPGLKHQIYPNYVAWGEDIQKNEQVIIQSVLRIPESLRTQWGVYKNLLNGITTLVNHGKPLVIADPLIDVFQGCLSLHSTRFEKRWKYKLNSPQSQGKIIVFHAAEGTDAFSKREIDRINHWNFFRRKWIAVHGVAMNARQAAFIQALVWCPDSNFFLLNQTANIGELKTLVPILFGTDSTLTASWSLWDHLRLAARQKNVSPKEIYNMVTETPARVWGFPLLGKIEKSYQADLVISRMKGDDYSYHGFLSLAPEDLLLVIHKGQIKLFDESIQSAPGILRIASLFSKVQVAGTVKAVKGDLPALMKAIRTYNPNQEFPVQYIP